MGVPTAEQIDMLVDRAQSGLAEEALAEARELVDQSGERPDASLFFACAVAADVLGDHGSAADYATAGVEAAQRDGRDGWRAVCLAMRALQVMSHGSATPDSFDETLVMRDLAQAQVTLLAGVESTGERIGAYCNPAVAYTRLRLYELAVPMYLEAATPVGGKGLPPEAAVVQQLNLATLHLAWTLELHHVGLVDDAGRHAAQALDHCVQAEHSAAGPHAETWGARARLFAGCARAHGPDPLAGVGQVQSSLADSRRSGPTTNGWRRRRTSPSPWAGPVTRRRALRSSTQRRPSRPRTPTSRCWPRSSTRDWSCWRRRVMGPAPDWR